MSPASKSNAIPHDSARGHVTGESVFIDDRAIARNELHVGVVGVPVAAGELLSIDTTAALAHPHCVGVFTAADFVHKKWGAIHHDQPFLVEKEIGYMGEPACVVVSDTREAVEEIKKLVKLEVSERPGIFTIDQARDKNSVIYRAMAPFIQGDPVQAMATATHRLKGVFVLGGQEHFYMESQAAVVYPLENGQVEVHSSSQHPSETQRVVAEALGAPLHHVTCVVKRMGGGFGGKESQAAPIAAYAAMAAQKFKRPARCILSKDDDMIITGKRHPFQNEWEVGFDDEGRIVSLIVNLQADGGAYADLSSSILERAMFHVDGAYYFANVRVDATCFRTNNQSHTAFRGFGGPQGTMTIESILEDVAHYLKKDAASIRRLNLYTDAHNRTPYGQLVENNMLPAIYDKLIQQSDYLGRMAAVHAHNQKRTGTLRGISLTATKFGIAFTSRFLNQGNALVNLQLDATVQVSTGATEMGQGVNTKIQQIVASAFGLVPASVQLMPTSTEKNHNTSATAASSGADINCAAALQAANEIKARLTALAKRHFAGDKTTMLQEIELQDIGLDDDILFADTKVKQRSSGKEIELKALINIAYFNRTSLGAYAFYRTPGLGFDKEKIQGRAFNYYTQGMAVTEVSVDEYTGEVKVLRTDIVMDLGRSINPGIDHGQVAGAYVQGMGWVTTEELCYDQKRNLLSHSPTTYKIPNIQDTPRVFNIELIPNDGNVQNVKRSKAVGEPPLLLGISAWTAVKHALSFRADRQVLQLSSPATSEKVLLELARLKGIS